MLSASVSDPDVAQAFATLHRRGVEVLGEEGLLNEMIKQAKANKPVSIFTLAQKK